MKVNLDGLRKSATASMNNLADEIGMLQDFLPDYKFKELKEAYNDTARNVGLFNCVYNDGDAGFNDISGSVEIRQFVET